MGIVFILLVGVLILTTYMWRRDADRKAQAHERKKEKFAQLMEILKRQNSDKNAEVNDPSTSLRTGSTEADENLKS